MRQRICPWTIRRLHLWGGLGLLLLVLFSTSCQPAPPPATPTATRTPILPTATVTPIPTSTPTATPTITPTPTPTLPPGLVLSGEAPVSDVCPPSPADLYFLKGGDLLVCLSEGGAPQPLIPTGTDGAESSEASIVGYEVSANRRYVTLISNEGQVSILDRAVGRRTAIPTAGRIIDPNGTYVSLIAGTRSLVYLAWGVQLDPGPALSTVGSGVIFAVDAMSPTLRQQSLGSCVGQTNRPCGGFLVSPNGAQLAIVDGEGVRLIDSAAQPSDDAGGTYLGLRPDGPLRLISWSPDGRWLLLSNQEPAPGASPAYALLSATADREQIAFTPLCPMPCRASAVWGRAAEGSRLWLAWENELEGCVAAVDTAESASGLLAVAPQGGICEAQSVRLRPSSPLAGSAAAALGGVVAFLQDAGPNVAAGVYALDTQAALRGVALLPEQPDRILWSAQGEAFLSLDAAGGALRLGLPRAAALWDVQTLLSGAEAFSWRTVNQE